MGGKQDNQQALSSCAAVLLPVSSAPAFAASFDGIISFGDSLSDVGNVYLATGGAEPASPYFDGRFSIGEIWLDSLEADLGVAAPRPILAPGTDFAFGEATTGFPYTRKIRSSRTSPLRFS